MYHKSRVTICALFMRFCIYCQNERVGIYVCNETACPRHYGVNRSMTAGLFETSPHQTVKELRGLKCASC